MIAEFISPNDARWIEMLEAVPYDFYHLPTYVTLAAEQENVQPVAFYAEIAQARFLVPLLLRDLPQHLSVERDLYDAISPYGYPSPLMSGPLDPGTLRAFLEQFYQASLAHRIVTVLLRLHPLLDLPFVDLSDVGTLVKHGQTVYIDLAVSIEELWGQTRRDHRADIVRLRRLGYEATMDDWAALPAFIALYLSTMSRVGASQSYHFSEHYFHQLRAVLGDVLHLCIVRAPDGEICCGGLFTAVGSLAQYHLSGSAEKFRRVSPTKLMLHFARDWAKGAGLRYLHLGGGVGGQEDALFTFKAGFSKLRADFYTHRMILDHEKHAMLVRRWEEWTGMSINDHTSNYFPAYRRLPH